MTPGQLRRGYGPIYRRLSRCGTEFSPAAKLVLLELLERLGQNSAAWPAQDTIQRDTGLSENTVRGGIRELVAAGFLRVERRGQGRTNVYTLDVGALLAWAEYRGERGSRTAESAEQEPLDLRNPPMKDRSSEDPSVKAASPAALPGLETDRPVKPTRTVVTEAYVEELRTEFGSIVRDFDASVKRCLAFRGYGFTSDKRQYLRDWLTRDAAGRGGTHGRLDGNGARTSGRPARFVEG